MERPEKREQIILVVIMALVIFADCCRIFDIPTEGSYNIIRAIIYPAIFIFWGYTLHRRLIHPQVRRFAVAIAALMVLWFAVRTIKYGLPDTAVDLSRYMWYLYYLPMLILPVLSFMLALSIWLPETKKLPKKTALFYIPAILLILLVITNDFHQLVFSFPDNGEGWTDDNYSHRPVFFIVYTYIFGNAIAVLAILTAKCRPMKGRSWLLLPYIPVLLMVCYCVLYFFSIGWFKFLFGDMTAACCVLYMAAIELCIRCGLIRTNTGYTEMFRSSRLGVQIIDREKQVCLSSSNAVNLTEEEIDGADGHGIMIGNDILLKSQPIHFGRVLWQEDVSELTEAIEEIEENCLDLAESNRITQERLDAEKRILVLQEKTFANELLQRETASQLAFIDRMLAGYEREPEGEESKRLLAGAAVVGAYIKRYGNLLLVSSRSESADSSDLIRCFEESFVNLELLGVTCLCSLPAGSILRTEDMLRVYKVFETVIEDCLFELESVWVHGRERKGKELLQMDFVCDRDLSQYGPFSDEFSQDSGSARFTFEMGKAGAEK